MPQRGVHRLFFVSAMIMIVSPAIFSFIFIDKNHQAIQTLQADIAQKDNLIAEVWSSKTREENRIDTIILLKVLAHESDDYKALMALLQQQHHDIAQTASVVEIFQAAKRSGQAKIEYINTLYIEKKSLEQSLITLTGKNQRYTAIVFLLQIISLVIIILIKP